ncbi:acyl-CoA dehydrogenase [Nocardioides aromaticivorans]|uniref:Acyl-CoA dehydrogenase n=1 Tax=Nocardioides aromaticivorans TaxID=200618 RepID=A0ABX7PS92_9ACTN|nr:acyl-CoA dehydrogenase [Nocardioides aromaticivorans]
MDESQDAAELRRLVRQIVGDTADPARVREFDDAEKFDEDLYAALAHAGLLQLEADADGTHASAVSEAVVLEELGATATSLAVSLVVQYMGLSLLCSHGTAQQREDVLEPLLAGAGRVAFALTEPDGGTDVARQMRTRATRQDDGSWSLTGTKTWITGASDCRWLIVLARTEDAGASAIDGITMFLVPRDAAGLDVSILDTVAIHSVSTCEVVLDAVVVGPGAVIGEEGRGFRQVIGTLNGERLNAAAVALGIARGAHTEAVRYAGDRQAFGRSIGAFQALQHRLADGAVAIEAARGLIQRAAAATERGDQSASVLTAMAKVAASSAATQATDDGMRLLGGFGLSREGDMQRFFRDARLYTFAPLTDEMIRNFIGEHHLGLPRSY